MKKLTARQDQVLLLIANGHSDAEIAEQMQLSLGTIHRYVGALRDRLKARNRAHAVTIALRAGMIDFTEEGTLCLTSRS